MTVTEEIVPLLDQHVADLRSEIERTESAKAILTQDDQPNGKRGPGRPRKRGPGRPRKGS